MQRNYLHTVKAIAIYKRAKRSSLPFLAITIVIATLYYSILPQLGLGDHQAIARCPNGTHKSPSGVCEQVVPHEGLPRCPNGFHRSPNGNCEAVNGNSNSESNHNNNAAGSNIIETPTSNNTSSLPSQCDQTLWNHVYNPARLQIVDQCKTVSGSIESITSGDQIMKLSEHIIDRHHGKMYLPYEMIKNDFNIIDEE
jgi:hypothetical protein